jgi:hypothetical protein
MHDLTLTEMTVARFVGTGDFLIKYSNGHTKYTYRHLKRSAIILTKRYSIDLNNSPSRPDLLRGTRSLLFRRLAYKELLLWE